jgi:hypothetical protein
MTTQEAKLSKSVDELKAWLETYIKAEVKSRLDAILKAQEEQARNISVMNAAVTSLSNSVVELSVASKTTSTSKSKSKSDTSKANGLSALNTPKSYFKHCLSTNSNMEVVALLNKYPVVKREFETLIDNDNESVSIDAKRNKQAGLLYAKLISTKETEYVNFLKDFKIIHTNAVVAIKNIKDDHVVLDETKK